MKKFFSICVAIIIACVNVFASNDDRGSIEVGIVGMNDYKPYTDLNIDVGFSVGLTYKAFTVDFIFPQSQSKKETSFYSCHIGMQIKVYETDAYYISSIPLTGVFTDFKETSNSFLDYGFGIKYTQKGFGVSWTFKVYNKTGVALSIGIPVF